MNVFTILVLTIIFIEVCIGIAHVGKPRNPRTPYEAVCGVIEWAVIVVLILLAVNTR